MKGLDRRIVDYCSDHIIERYYYRSTISIRVEEYEYPEVRLVNQKTIDLYVKSAREPSIDEIPILRALFSALRNSKVRVYEYERMVRGGEPRHRTLGRILEEGLRAGRPALIIMPSALPASLYSILSPLAREMLSNSVVLKAVVEYQNYLYLPKPERADEIELVAKTSSSSSYERVQWLRSEARRRGIYVAGEKYLSDNKSILEYVLWEGIEGLYRRVPVNKLALYISALSDCGVVEDIEKLERREEAQHLIYGVNVDAGIVSGIKEELESIGRDRVGDIMGGVLSSLLYEGVHGIVEEIVKSLL